MLRRSNSVEETAMSGVVVGYDGSANARGALQWAIGEAALRDTTLCIAQAYSEPLYVWSDPYALQARYEQLRAGLQAELDLVADHAEGELRRPVTRVLESGSVTELLLRLGREAELLVVGARGAGGFAGLRLGSAANQLAHHTPCPLVIVPPSG